MMSVLYEMYVSSTEKWLETSLYISMKAKSKVKRTGVMRWMSAKELAERYGPAMSEDLIKRKGEMGAWQWHPYFVGVDEMKLFRCFDSKVETTEDCWSQELALESKGEVNQADASALMS